MIRENTEYVHVLKLPLGCEIAPGAPPCIQHPRSRRLAQRRKPDDPPAGQGPLNPISDSASET